MHRHRLVPRYPRRDDSAFVAFIFPFSLFPFLPSLFLFNYLYPSWSFIHCGIAPICSCKRFARDIQSMPIYMLRSSLATADPRVNVVRIFTDYIACVTIYFVILKIKFYDARKECTERWFKLILLSVEGISRFLLLYSREERIRKLISWTAQVSGKS